MSNDSSKLSVVYAASEMAPFAKTGGLGDVVGTLPQELARLNVEVNVFLPYYQEVQNINASFKKATPSVLKVPHGSSAVDVELLELQLADNVRLFCVKYDSYFKRDLLYGPDGGYPDNAHRFALFSRAIVEAEATLGLNADVFHLNDWQTALVPAYLRAVKHRAKTLFTIHNLAYQGRFWKWDLPWTGLDWSLFTPSGIEYFGEINFLKAGLLFADIVSTVGPTYAEEIVTQTEPPSYATEPSNSNHPYDIGEGLSGVLASMDEKIIGILNGIDTHLWNPKTDEFIKANYDRHNLSGKNICKKALQEFAELPTDEATPVMGLVSRLSNQKGIDILIAALSKLFDADMQFQFIAIGSGSEKLQNKLLALQEAYPKSVHVQIGYSERVAHMIEAGADIFLMPSRFEPCGLNQMYSMRYGTIPVVHNTGGLKDTVEPYAPTEGTGFVFEDYSADELLGAIQKAITVYRDNNSWRDLMHRAMSKDWSWSSAAQKYRALYERLIG